MNKQFFAMAVALCITTSCFQAKADNGVGAAKVTDYTATVRPDNYTESGTWGAYFTFPSGVNIYANEDLADSGFTFSAESSNTDLLVVDNCGYDAEATGNKNYLSYHLNKMVAGEAILTITCTYQGESVTVTKHFTVNELPDYTFAPKKDPSSYSLTGTRPTAEKVIIDYMTSWFEIPMGWNDAAYWEENGITWGVDADSNEIISDITTSLKESWGTTYPQISFTIQPKSGKTNLTFWIERNGIRSETKYVSNIYAVNCKDDVCYIQLKEGNETDADIMPNDDFMSEYTATVSILNQPKYGTATVVDKVNGWGNKNKSIRYAFTGSPNDIANYSEDKFRYSITLTDKDGNVIEVSEADLTMILRQNPFATKVFEYVAAPGQFVNASYFDAESLLRKDANTGSSDAPASSGMITLGAFGGYVVLGFDSPVYNDPTHPYGIDFSITGNPMKGSSYGYWTEPGAVMVMRDDNGNGLPDDTWYELAGSDYWFSTTRHNATFTYEDPGYASRHIVPWTDEQGNTGGLNTVMFRGQSYFPRTDIYPDAKIENGKLSLSGALIAGNYDMRNPNYIEAYRPLAFGYTDNHVSKGDLTVPVNPYVAETLADGTKTSPADCFDISWAVDADGNYVDLDHIDFVKVYNSVFRNCSAMVGESSTEVCNIVMTRPGKSEEPQPDVYLNYANTYQLVVCQGETVRFDGVAFKNGRVIKDATATWTVDNPEIGTIDADGNFTGLKVGNTHIRFHATDMAPADVIEVEVVNLDGVVLISDGKLLSAESKLTMLKDEKSWVDAQSTIAGGSSIDLYGAKSNRYVYDSYTWTSSNPMVVAVDEHGSIKALSLGNATISATSKTNTALTASFTIEVIDIPEVTKSSRYLVIEDQRLTQETLNAKKFSCNDIMSALYSSNGLSYNKRIDFKKVEVKPAEYADKFYIADGMLCNRLVLGDYREYMLTVTGMLDGKETTVNLPLLHTSGYNTLFPFEINEDAVINVSKDSRSGELNLSEVFLTGEFSDIYADLKYRISADNIFPEEANIAITDGILTFSYETDEMPDVKSIIVEAWCGRANQRMSVPAADGMVPESASWKKAVIRVDTVETGVENVGADRGQLRIFPNPTAYAFSLGNSVPVEMALWSQGGTLLYSDTLYPGETVDVSHLPAGIYVVTTAYGQSFKLVKK